MPTVKIMTSTLASHQYHQDRVNAFLDELHADGITNAKIEHFIDNAIIVTIITVGSEK